MSAWSVPNSDRFVIPASGEDIAGASDRFRFVYQILAGDVQIKARLDSFASTGMKAKAGLMIRRSLEAGAAHGSVLMSADGALAFHGRRQDGAGATPPSGNTTPAAPQWMALERAGSRVVAYSSPDGNTWTAVGSEDITLGEIVYVGIAVTGAVTGSVAVQGPIADMSQVAVSGLPPWQRQRDIGEPVIRGRAWRTEGTYTMTGAGAIEEARDRFNFVYQPMQGDVDVVARVASLAADTQNAQAGVMIRESLAADSRHAFALVAVSTGYAFDRRDRVGEWSEHTDGGPGTPPGWVRLSRRGNDIDAFRSNDGLAWTSMGSTELVTDGQVFVGLAVTSQDTGAETTAVFDAVNIVNIAPVAGAPNRTPTGTSPSVEDTGLATTGVSDGVSETAGLLPNVPPVVALTSPLPGAAFTAPATITLTALATDLEGRLTQVRFYANTNLIGTVSATPYTFSWASVPAGSYSLTAVAADADGGSTTSLAVPITVASSPNQPPAVTLTSPASGATYTAPATISLTAAASDPENRLARVEFYRGSTLLGTDTSSPYAFTWSSVPAGSYTLTAVATDADGESRTSTAVNITVNAAPSPVPSRVIVTASTDHDTNVTSYLLEVFPSGTDPHTGSPSASSDLGKPTPDANRDITVDRASFFNALSPGNYLATVSAIGPGGSARSEAVAFTR